MRKCLPGLHLASQVTWHLGPCLKQVAGARAGNQMGISPLSQFTEGLTIITRTRIVIALTYRALTCAECFAFLLSFSPQPPEAALLIIAILQIMKLKYRGPSCLRVFAQAVPSAWSTPPPPAGFHRERDPSDLSSNGSGPLLSCPVVLALFLLP